VKIIKVSGTGKRRELAESMNEGIEESWMLALERGDRDEEPATGEQIEEWLRTCGLFGEGATVLLETNEPFVGLDVVSKVFITDAPMASLEPEVREAAKGADLVLVERAGPFEGESEAGLESAIKDETDARKVLIYRDDGERERAFAKAADMVRSKLGGDNMPDDVPQVVLDAVKDAADEGRISCEAAHALSSELGVPLEVVGRALDLANIKITRCQLGCF
jgi:hypothetical protein